MSIRIQMKLGTNLIEINVQILILNFRPILSEILSCTKFKSNMSEASLTCLSLPEFTKFKSNCCKLILFPFSDPDSFARSVPLDP